jgi:hypothetical protein
LLNVLYYSKAESNPRGIPLAPFVDDVESFLTSRDEIEPNLKKFQEMIACVSSLGITGRGYGKC